MPSYLVNLRLKFFLHLFYGQTIYRFYFKFVAKNSVGQGNDDPSEPLGSSDFTADALRALNCLTILTRSTHNCKVFSYYGGVQKITALLKGTWI